VTDLHSECISPSVGITVKILQPFSVTGPLHCIRLKCMALKASHSYLFFVTCFFHLEIITILATTKHVPEKTLFPLFIHHESMYLIYR
jgi:hypothetical protein